jgi:ribokinase
MTGGGKGANQALACARLGAEVCMIGCVGNDDFGLRLKEVLTESKVDCRHLRVVSGVGTGVAIVTVTESGDNAIVLAPGANACVESSLITEAADAFKKADAVMFQLEIPLGAVEAGLHLARKSGCRTILTPAPAREIPPALWALVDTVVLNENELAFYVKEDRLETEEELVTAARQLVERGPLCVLVTRGARGGLAVSKKDFFDYAPFQVEALDSTGAGDAFCAAFTVTLAEGLPLREAILYASAAGALACTRFGAHPSMPWRHEVQALLQNSRNG